MIIEIIGIPDEVLEKKGVANKYRLEGETIAVAIADLKRIDEAMTGKIRKEKDVLKSVDIFVEVVAGREFENYLKLQGPETRVGADQNVQFRPVIKGAEEEDERSDAFADLLKVHPIMEAKAKREAKYKLTNIKHWKFVRVARTKCREKHDWKITNPGASEKIGAICTRCTINVTVTLQEMAEYGSK